LDSWGGGLLKRAPPEAPCGGENRNSYESALAALQHRRQACDHCRLKVTCSTRRLQCKHEYRETKTRRVPLELELELEGHDHAVL
jgi:hypothetical protein